MPAWGPVSRRQLVTVLRHLGFQGPYSGDKHEFMVAGRVIGFELLHYRPAQPATRLTVETVVQGET